MKQSIKQAAKRGDTATAKLLAKEIVRSHKAVSRLHTSKAQMNSVVMQMQNQMGALPVPPHSRKPTTPTHLSGVACRHSATKGHGPHGQEHAGHGRHESPGQDRGHFGDNAGHAEGDVQGVPPK